MRAASIVGVHRSTYPGICLKLTGSAAKIVPVRLFAAFSFCYPEITPPGSDRFHGSDFPEVCIKAEAPPGNQMRCESQKELREKAERFDRFTESVPALLYDYVIDENGIGRCLYCSPYSVQLVGVPPEEFMADMGRFLELIHPDDRDEFRRKDLEANRRGTIFFMELRVVTADGEQKWLRLSSSKNRAREGRLPIWSGYMIDITDTKRLESVLNDRATHDFLTGLANRQHFQRQFETELARSKRYGRAGALLLLDLDHFKRVNDRYGHDLGDHVLKELARLVQDRLRTADTFARWGGEEFCILLPETGRAEALEVAERIRRDVEMHPFGREPDRPIRITLSIGLTGIDADVDRIETAMRRADEALYDAKRAGRNRVVGN